MSPTIFCKRDFGYAGTAGARFVINTTIGVAGIFDVATDWGLPERSRDFGETLGVYGVGQGPYLVLPFRGPTVGARLRRRLCRRLFLAAVISSIIPASNYVGLVKSSLGSVDNRSANIVTYRDIERASVDFYATMRAYYRQRRERQVEDRASPDRGTSRLLEPARNRLSIGREMSTAPSMPVIERIVAFCCR